ncbi:MAG: tyrosine-protein phosphatase [Acidimicrobiales bacterium]
MTVLLASRNLRDLGGMPTRSGAQLATGRLFRSGQLAALEPDEHEVLTGLGLTTIVDLRRNDEIKRLPTPDLGAQTVNISPNSGTSEFAVQAAAIAEGRDANIDLEAFPRGYRQMAVDPYRIDRYREVVLTLMTRPRQPALFHCTAGKDRTGWTAALLLSIAGVDQELIVEDYLFTNHVRADHNVTVVEEHRTRIAERKSIDPGSVTDDDLAAIRSLVEVRVDYLDSAFAGVQESHGSFDRYRREALGIDDATVEAFQADILV